MKENSQLSEKFKGIIENLVPKPAQVSFAVINLTTLEPEISGYNMEQFVYPASIYKVFIGAEILRKVSCKELILEDKVEIQEINEANSEIVLFPKEGSQDERPALMQGDMVTLDYLLDLMLTRSDNTAANTLMDIAEREQINENIIIPNGWHGSDITRKFIDRLKEQEKYRKSEVTVSNAKHLVELFYKIDKGELVNSWVSQKLKEYMLRWNRAGRGGLYLQEFSSYYRKGGFLYVNGYRVNFWKALKNVLKGGHAVNKWIGDAGVVTGTNSHYVIAVLTLTKSKWPWTRFPMKKFSKQVYNLMETLKL